MIKTFLCLIAIGLFTTLKTTGQEPGLNNDPFQKSVGEGPYEMKDRKEVRDPFLTFDDCSQWQVLTTAGDAKLYRTQEQRVIGKYSGKVAFQADTAQHVNFRVELIKPVLLKKEWDCINFWNYGPMWLWESGPGIYHSLIIKDAKGKEKKIPFVQEWLWPFMCYKYWYLDHIKLNDSIVRPVTLVGMEFKGKADPKQKYNIYLGPVYAYKEELKPLTFKPLPKKLPFPLRQQTILPTNKVNDFKNSIVREGKVYQFKYQANDASLVYEVDPVKPIGGISVLRNGERKAVDSGAEIVFANKVPVVWTVMNQNLAGDTLFVKYRAKGKNISVNFDCYYTINQKSLIWGIEEKSAIGHVEEIRLGKTGKINDGKLVAVPLLCYNLFANNSYVADQPNLLYADGLFYLTMFDWYYTNASMFFGGQHGIADGYASYNGGVRYIPLNNKTRNPIRERLFINVSPDVQEVFPTIDNPRSPMRSMQADRLWSIGMGNNLDTLGKFVSTMRSKGIEKVSIRYHEDFWREDGESYTFKLTPNPSFGVKRVQDYVRFVQSNDWRIGLYSNYMDFAPVNALWNEDWVRRSHLGGWGPGWSRCYAPKVSVGWEQEAILAPQIHKIFGSNFSYCDVETCISPMDRVDYDSRTPGAGKFRSVIEYIGLTVMNERRAYKGPVYSEGGIAMFYAGLVDGNYLHLGNNVAKFPDFQLLKLHPLEMDAMNFAPEEGYIAHALAFGAIGILSNGRDGIRRYAFLQPMQSSYSMIPVRKIAYSDGNLLVSSSEAVKKDLIKAPKICIEYESGFQVYSNLSNKDWNVSVNDKNYILSKNGVLSFMPEQNLMAYSVVNTNSASRKLLDRVYSPELYYLDTRGETVTGDLAGKGSYMLKKEKFGWEIIPVEQAETIEFDLSLIGYGNYGVDIEAVDDKGNVLETINAEPVSHRVKFSHKPACFKYRIAPVTSIIK